MLPSKAFLLSLFLCTCVVFLGPYEYEMRSSSGAWIYVYFCFLMFLVGMLVGENSIGRSSKPCFFAETELTLSAEYVLLLIALIVFIATLYAAIQGVSVSGGGLGLAAGKARNELELLAMQGRKRDFSVKAADAIANGSLALALIVLGCRKVKVQLLFWLSVLTPLLFAFSQLLMGGRNPAALVILTMLLFFVARRRSGNLPTTFSMRAFKVGFALFAVLLMAIMILMFAWRSRLEDITGLEVGSMAMWNGEATLRQSYATLNSWFDGGLSGLYSLLYYVGHAIPFFTALFDASSYETVYFGMFHFGIFPIILGRTDIFFEMIHSQPFYGLYPTMVQGFLLDFGPVLAPFFIFLAGLVFGLVAIKARRGGRVTGWIYPLVLALSLISPIYYLNWGSSSFVFVTLMVIILALKISGFLLSHRVFKARESIRPLPAER